MIPEAIFQDVLEGRTQMFEDQASNRGAAGAVAQSHLRPKETDIRVFTFKQRGFPCFEEVKPSRQGLCCCQSVP